MFFAYQYHTKESFLTISDDIYGFNENVSSGVSFTSTNFITFGYLVQLHLLQVIFGTKPNALFLPVLHPHRKLISKTTFHTQSKSLIAKYSKMIQTYSIVVILKPMRLENRDFVEKKITMSQPFFKS